MLYIDIETYSTVDLTKSNVYRYTECPEFDILMTAWSRDGTNFHLAVGQDEITKIPGLFSDMKVAHNAPFERICFSAYLGEALRAEYFIDTQAMAAAAGLPKSLDGCAKALGAENKDSGGKALIRKFCVPNRKGERNLPEDFPADWEDFCAYCVQDVRTLVDVHQRLPDMTTGEKTVYLVDQRINDRGIRVDVDLAKIAQQTAEKNRMEEELEFTQITGVDNPASTQQVHKWLENVGHPLPDLRAETVKEAFQDQPEGPVKQALRLRQQMALSSSTKFEAALKNVCEDGRLRGAFMYHGAHTGRWTGRGVQLHNLAKASVDDPETAIWDLLNGFGADPYTLKALVRPMFLGPFVVADFSAIEARVLAWLAGEQWLLDAFEAGRDIYVETAKRMGGLTRDQGKTAVLALGYQGAIGSLRVMGGEGTDEELLQQVRRWRQANPAVVDFWRELEQTFITGGTIGWLRIVRDEKNRHVHLPSGRIITYHDVRKRHARSMGIEEDKKLLSFIDPRYGSPTATYGGKLTENMTQAVARDVLADALVRLEENDYPVVGHVHDEVLVEHDDIEGVVSTMIEPPKWAKGLPINAEGFYTERYKKD